MIRVLRAAAVVAFVVGCAGSPPAAAPAPTAARQTPVRTDVLVREESFTPLRGDSALRAFIAEVAPYEEDGECQLLRTSGSGATTVSAAFPTRASARMTVAISFDSAGHVVSYSETRGVPPPVKLPPGTPRDRLDSAFAVGRAAVRSTVVTLNFPLDRAMIMNRGGGKPTNAVMAAVVQVEHLASLAGPAARMERVRKLCGV